MLVDDGTFPDTFCEAEITSNEAELLVNNMRLLLNFCDEDESDDLEK